MKIIQLNKPIKALIDGEFQEGNIIISSLCSEYQNSIKARACHVLYNIDESLEKYISEEYSNITIYNNNILSIQEIEL